MYGGDGDGKGREVINEGFVGVREVRNGDVV